MTVYQVQAIDPKGGIRIVHAYETALEAQQAVKTMKSYGRGGIRYVVVPVMNDPNQFWGINF